MSLILSTRPWDSQPQEVAPLASGARGQLLLNPALGSRNLGGREGVWGYQGNASRILTNRGYAYALDGSGDSLSLTGNDEITGNVGTLAVWLARVGAPSLYGHVYIGSQSPNAVAMQITEAGGTQVFGGGLNGGGSAISGWFNTVNRSAVFASGGTAATCAVYIDGRNTGHTYTGAPLAWGSGSKTIYLGRYPAAANWDTNADILCAYLATDVWNEAQAAQFHANPWAVVYAPRRIWVPVAEVGGGGGFQAAWARNRNSVIGAGVLR